MPKKKESSIITAKKHPCPQCKVFKELEYGRCPNCGRPLKKRNV